MIPKEYLDRYEVWTREVVKYHMDTSRPDYDAEVWFSHNRNKIAMSLIGDRWKGKKVLVVGAAFWVDKELQEMLHAEVLRTDLIQSEGIDMIVDVCNMSFPDESFDCVICREVIEHVPEDRELLFEVRRVLKPEGEFYLTTPNAFNILPDGVMHVRGYSPLNLIEALETYGFSILAKKGNLPNIYRALVPLSKAGLKEVLVEFMELEHIWEKNEDSYYFGSELCVLAKKENV